jgi:hypothetical protein
MKELNFFESTIGNHCTKITKYIDELIMSRLKLLDGFKSLEQSAHLCEIRQIGNAPNSRTEYVFNGEVFLTIYPPSMEEKDGKFLTSFTYK